MNKKEIEKIAKIKSKNFCNKYGISSFKILENFIRLKISSNGFEYDWESELKNNPYILMKLENVGFQRADSIAMALKFPIDHKYRILAYVGVALDNLSNGSTIIGLEDVLTYMSNNLNISDSVKIIDVVLNQSDESYKMLDNNCKVTKDFKMARYLTRTIWYEVERDWYKLCSKISKLNPLNIPSEIINSVLNKYTFKLNSGQIYGINNFYKNGLCVLTGKAGSGKTFMTKIILDIFKKLKYTYTALTPTGISSKVFTNSTGVKSKTVHSYYYGGGRIETDYLILDECSMYSIDHIKMILSMVDSHNPPRILMIGDCNQLSPISPSAPFRDIINLMDCGRLTKNIINLTEIMRASSELYIPHLCNQFIGDNIYDTSTENKKDLKGVVFERLNKNSLCEQILSVINRNMFSFDNTVILIPQNIGDLGNNVVNDFLDEIVATDIVLYKDKFKTFRKGSYCMNTKNNRELNIYNGERVILIDRIGDTFICKKVDDDTIIEYSLDLFRDSIQLSYALSVHKTQGITVDNVIFVSSTSHLHMLNKNLIYTGISRASKHITILYDKNSLSIGSKNKIIDKRITFLSKLSEIKKKTL